MIHELRDLGHRTEARPLRGASPGVTFSAAVEEALWESQGNLRYSRRLELLSEADALGLRRFEANLIIALCCHRHPALPRPASASARWMPALACVVLMQGAIIAAVWKILL